MRKFFFCSFFVVAVDVVVVAVYILVLFGFDDFLLLLMFLSIFFCLLGREIVRSRMTRNKSKFYPGRMIFLIVGFMFLCYTFIKNCLWQNVSVFLLFSVLCLCVYVCFQFWHIQKKRS